MEKAIILVSGGLDSCVTAAIAAEKYKPAFLHVNYGQKTETRELKAFHQVADFYNISDRLVVDISYLKEIGGSALTDDQIEVPAADLNSEKIPVTYVPFRNGNLISIAASWAEIINVKHLFIGVVQEDSSGYPDCREVFIKAIETAVNYGTRPELKLKIRTPLVNLPKKEIIQTGIKLGAPLELTWSCYQNEVLACGICDSCALRLKAFQQLNMADPIGYKLIPEYHKP